MTENIYSLDHSTPAMLMEKIEVDIISIGGRLDSVTLIPRESTEEDFLCKEIVDEIFQRNSQVSFYVSNGTLIFEGHFGVIYVSLEHIETEACILLRELDRGNFFIMKRAIGFSLIVGE